MQEIGKACVRKARYLRGSSTLCAALEQRCFSTLSAHQSRQHGAHASVEVRVGYFKER